MSPWYPISTMKTAHVPVRIRKTGYEVLAEIRKHPKLSDVGKPVWWWYEIKPSGSLVPLAAVGIEQKMGWDAWQPPNARHWPSPLPEPLSSQIGAVAWQSPPPAPEPDDGTEQGDGWPYPGLRLGSLVPPRHVADREPWQTLGPFDTAEERQCVHDDLMAMMRSAGARDLPLQPQ